MPRDLDTVMWLEACELLQRAERLQRQFFQPGPSRGQRPTWEPPIDVYETERDVWVLVALPGVEPQRLEVVFDDGVLVVAGERMLPDELRQAAIYRLEIPFGRFERRVRLPAGLYEIGRRDLSGGCLTLCLHKRS